ncbi:hypothetical protein ABBQ32_011398 [Trebouxia sp. C0010 RCD-2024]
MMHAGYPGQLSDTRKKTDCKYHLEGRCSLGDKCPFRHVPELFNSAARVAFAPHSQASVCHFYLNGKCTKGDLCAFQHPGSQKEMQINFDDDESPKQTEQGRPAREIDPKGPSSTPQANSPRQSMQARRPAQASPPQQPLSSRLGPQSGTHRRHPQTSAADQDASPVKQPVKSVFDRLNKVKGSPALQDRLSKSTPVELESTSIRRPTHAIKRPIIDASQLLLETITAKARVGRKVAELAGRTPSSQARQSSTDLEPTSISQRRMVAVNRGSRATPTPAHAPKFASPIPSESTEPRRSALTRLAPRQNGTAASSSLHTPATAPRPRQAAGGPAISSRLKPDSTSHPPAHTPGQTPQASGGASINVTPATGSMLASTPSSEVFVGGTDRRGRQKICWQPPTASQREDSAQEAKQSLNKRKASDAASPALETAAASAAAEDTSPSKRMKASDPADPPKPSAMPQGRGASAAAKQDSAAPMLDASTAEAQEEQADGGAESAPDSALDMDDDDDGGDDVDLKFDEGDDEEEVLYDDFDDEAAMRQLEALG